MASTSLRPTKKVGNPTSNPTFSSPTTLKSHLPWESPVETTKGWRHYKSAEKSAGMESACDQVLVKYFTCDLCEIGIGPDHHEQELYFLPIVEGKECLVDTVTIIKHKCLQICGGCARNRHLSEEHCIIPETLWGDALKASLETLLDGVKQLLTQVEMVLATMTYDPAHPYPSLKSIRAQIARDKQEKERAQAQTVKVPPVRITAARGHINKNAHFPLPSSTTPLSLPPTTAERSPARQRKTACSALYALPSKSPFAVA